MLILGHCTGGAFCTYTESDHNGELVPYFMPQSFFPRTQQTPGNTTQGNTRSDTLTSPKMNTKESHL